ncbi:hypothetical protein [Streptomyces sp. NBC_01187]|uniref:hypothetical protein n=1 Tax=Streptomyces sp. NBC_01187 TaxID=2903766 RepID=UPI003866F06D|nr:hypothetical protein OG220_37490 [Streptomyces sp. NBC_01187]
MPPASAPSQLATATTTDAVPHPDAHAVSGTARSHAVSAASVEPGARAAQPAGSPGRSGTASGAPFRAAPGTAAPGAAAAESALALSFVARAFVTRARARALP